MATSDVRALTQAYRAAQVREAAKVAAAVAVYYRTRVDPNSAGSVDRWLSLILPRIIRGHQKTARLGAKFASDVRSLEVAGEPRLDFNLAPEPTEEKLRRSFEAVGPRSYLDKARKIEELDLPPTSRKAMLIEAKETTATKIAGAAVRHIQDGGRQTIHDVVRTDRLALGYVRVTRAKPCFFCAMLASRGLVYADDSFDASDARFTGDGKVKVHDECACTLKAVYRRTDPLLDDAEKFEDLWERWGAGGGGSDAALRFRRGYEHWVATGEFLEWDVVNDRDAFRARNKPAA